MTRGLHKKPESQFVKGICIHCGKNKQMSKGICRKGPNAGKKIYKNTCLPCSLKADPEKLKREQVRKNLRTRPWVFHKKDKCENCGFIPLHPCQLDVDHIDGNHDNNDPSNYRTLCANCHRLKTYINKDWNIS